MLCDEKREQYYVENHGGSGNKGYRMVVLQWNPEAKPMVIGLVTKLSKMRV
jgi:hypothetical protein